MGEIDLKNSVRKNNSSPYPIVDPLVRELLNPDNIWSIDRFHEPLHFLWNQFRIFMRRIIHRKLERNVGKQLKNTHKRIVRNRLEEKCIIAKKKISKWLTSDPNSTWMNNSTARNNNLHYTELVYSRKAFTIST